MNHIPLQAMLLLSALSFTAMTGAEVVAKDRATNRPNIIIILTDDQGYGDVSAYRDPDDESIDFSTPSIDSIAKNGMLFTNMRANCTVCSPSRAALLTGCYPDRVGVPGVIRTHPENSWGYLRAGVPTLANQLGNSGYHTAAIGKWHLGLESPNTPNERGFDFFHGFLGDMMDSYTSHLRHQQNYMRRNDQVIAPEGHATEIFAQWAIDYINQQAANAEQPFFLYLAFNAPHFPIEPPQEWLQKVQQRAPGLDAKRAKNVAFVEHLDHHIGRVLQAVKDCGIEHNTVIAMSADNGGSLPHAQSNVPWRDGKQSHFDGGLRVPFMVSWPGTIAPGTTSDYAGQLFDLFPTMIEIAGGEVPTGIDAISLAPILRGESVTRKRDLYFVRREGGPAYGGKDYHALIRDRWKLMQNNPFEKYSLYDLKNDPFETTDVAAEHQAVVRELSAAISRQIQAAGTVPWQH